MDNDGMHIQSLAQRCAPVGVSVALSDGSTAVGTWKCYACSVKHDHSKCVGRAARSNIKSGVHAGDVCVCECNAERSTVRVDTTAILSDDDARGAFGERGVWGATSRGYIAYCWSATHNAYNVSVDYTPTDAYAYMLEVQRIMRGEHNRAAQTLTPNAATRQPRRPVAQHSAAQRAIDAARDNDAARATQYATSAIYALRCASPFPTAQRHAAQRAASKRNAKRANDAARAARNA